MKIEILSKDYTVKDYLKELVNKKVEKLSRYFNDTAVAKVFCKLENDIYKMEITIVDAGIIYKSENSSDNMYENLDIILPKVEKQILKTLDKNKDKLRKLNPTEDFAFIEKAPKFKPLKIVKNKKVELVPVTDEEALTRFEMMDNDFYVYLSRSTGKVCIMYRRHDGNVGVIETDK